MIETKVKQNPKSWEADYQAGLIAPTAASGKKPLPQDLDSLSYYSGMIEGIADRAKPPEQRKPHTKSDRTATP
jgi:hypothetical protein